MKILVLTQYSIRGASSRLRIIQYLPFLIENDFEIKVSPLFNDSYLKNLYLRNRKSVFNICYCYFRRLYIILSCKKYDLLLIEKELFPWFPAWIEQILFFFKIPYVVDYDDAIFHKYDLSNYKLVRFMLGGKIRKIMKCSSLVIAGNQYIANYAKNAAAKYIEKIPTVVDINRYQIVSERPPGVFTIGWIGSPSTSKYLYLVKNVITQFCKEVQAQLVIVGSGELKFGDIPIEIRTWTEATEVEDIQSFDVGIMPLSASPWELGKCGYKLIQYMACGIPVIASPIGVNNEIVENGINGYLANTSEEWMLALKNIYNQPKLNMKLGAFGRTKVESQYSLQFSKELFLNVLIKAS